MTELPKSFTSSNSYSLILWQSLLVYFLEFKTILINNNILNKLPSLSLVCIKKQLLCIYYTTLEVNL